MTLLKLIIYSSACIFYNRLIKDKLTMISDLEQTLLKRSNSTIYKKIAHHLLKNKQSFVNINSQSAKSIAPFLSVILILAVLVILIIIIPIIISHYINYGVKKIQKKESWLYHILILAIYYYTISDYILLLLILLFFTMTEVF